jgi:murein DD-endopeptidase MepM/ murein hydrolase activator NlpD
MTPDHQLIPDSEVVFSGTAVDFDFEEYIESAGGRLSKHREYLGSTGWNSGADEIRRLAFENSISPRLLLALLEYESRWVRGDAVDSLHRDYPMGYINLYYKGLFGQMLWTVNQLSIGYYGWRTGELTEIQFPDGTRLRLNPQLNAGTVAIQYLFAKQHNQSQWAQMIEPGNGFLAVYTEMFGDPWARADTVDPLFPPGLSQPELALPFDADIGWSYTGGPHGAWEHDGALAAVDFAPFTDHGGCDPTPTWVTAAAAGKIVRSERGVVIQDLDGDGFEQTGWALVYLHIAAIGRVAEGEYVERDDRIGHASCEGGQATGTHLHFARKYNGEWVAADGPIPFVLSGWVVQEGDRPYEGTLVRGDEVVIADPVGQLKSVIIRRLDDE